MRSFLESYQVMARVLSNHQEYKFPDDSEFVDECMKQGEEMLLRKQIGSASALSEPLFATAARLAHYRGLMAGEPDDIIARRKQFAAEISDAVRAVRLLQEHYNQHQGLT